MEAEEKAKLLSEKYLNNNDVSFEIEYFEDRQLNPIGWQYKKFGNSTKGRDKLTHCRKDMKLNEDNGKCARNDSDLRYYENSIYTNENKVIELKTSPSRSGNTCLYTFFTVTKNDNKTLIARKNEALKNAEKFKNNEKVFNSFIKLSNNIQEEIENNKSNEIKIEKNNKSTQQKDLLDLVKNNSIDEDYELDEYIKIYTKHGFKEHYEVNHHITKNNLWNKFPNIRSLNDHSGYKGIPGILPKFYAKVCERLEIKGAGGSPLDKATHY